MNKYQKLINQIVKDDLSKSWLKKFIPDINFIRARRIAREAFKGKPLEWLKEYKEFNKSLEL